MKNEILTKLEQKSFFFLIPESLKTFAKAQPEKMNKLVT